MAANKQAHNLYVMFSATGATPSEIQKTLSYVNDNAIKDLAKLVNVPFTNKKDTIEQISFKSFI